MDTTADKTLSVAGAGSAKDGTGYKGLGAVFSMDCRYHVQTDVGTWLDAENACRKDGLHPAVHIQGVEREKEYVVGNHLQD